MDLDDRKLFEKAALDIRDVIGDNLNGPQEQACRWFLSAIRLSLNGYLDDALREASRGASELLVEAGRREAEKEMRAKKSLPPGTHVSILWNGEIYRVVVDSAVNYGSPDNPDWYIECHEENARGEKYNSRFWKQSQDKGTAWMEWV